MTKVYEINVNLPRRSFAKHVKAAKNRAPRLENPKDILAIDYTDLKFLLKYDHDFFNHCMNLANKVVAQLIRDFKEMYADQEDEETAEYYAMLKDVETLEDLLNSSDYLGDDYESRRREFVNLFVDYRWDYEKYFN